MDSGFLDNYRFLGRYNAWFNGRLYDACDRLSDAERKQDRGAFFGSIHDTLNHIVWGDRLWLRRFADQEGAAFPQLEAGLLSVPEGAVHATVLHADWHELRDNRNRLDEGIQEWLAGMPDDYPLRTMRYANTKGVRREHPTWIALTHFFNHQAHHRGQVTALLMQAGVDPGVTDLIALAPDALHNP